MTILYKQWNVHCIRDWKPSLNFFFFFFPQNCDFAISDPRNNLLSHTTWNSCSTKDQNHGFHTQITIFGVEDPQEKEEMKHRCPASCADAPITESCWITGPDCYLLYLCLSAVGQILTCPRKTSATLGGAGVESGGNMSLKALQYYLSAWTAWDSPEKRQFLQGPGTGSSMWRQLNS